MKRGRGRKKRKLVVGGSKETMSQTSNVHDLFYYFSYFKYSGNTVNTIVESQFCVLSCSR